MRRFRASNVDSDPLELMEEVSTEVAAMRARAPKRAQDTYSRIKPTRIANYLDNDYDPIYFASEEAERGAESALADIAQSSDAMEVSLALEREGGGRTVPASPIRGKSSVAHSRWVD